jgi:hypothetical protein
MIPVAEQPLHSTPSEILCTNKEHAPFVIWKPRSAKTDWPKAALKSQLIRHLAHPAYCHRRTPVNVIQSSAFAFV